MERTRPGGAGRSAIAVGRLAAAFVLVLFAGAFLGAPGVVDRAEAEPLTPFSVFAAMTPAELAKCQVKLTFGFESGSGPPPTYLFATSRGSADLPAFFPFARRGFSYVSDHIEVPPSSSTIYVSPVVVVVSPAELLALLRAVGPLPEVVDGGVDSSAQLSFSILQKAGGTTRCFESLLDAAHATRLLVAMKHAWVSDAVAYDAVADFACSYHWLGKETAALVPPSDVAVVVGNLHRLGANGAWRYDGTVTVQNISPRTLVAPLFLVLAAKGSYVRLRQASGSTCRILPSGAPYVVLPVSAGLAHGDTVTLTVTFDSPSAEGIELNYVAPSGAKIIPRVFQGMGER